MKAGQRLMDVVKICLSLDQLSEKTYALFSKQAESPELSRFWAQMAKEEAWHVKFWSGACNCEEIEELPCVFDDVDYVAAELIKSKAEADAMLRDAAGSLDTATMFLIALRMEFYLLHPAIGTLFQYLGSHTEMKNPADTYDQHIGRLLEALNSYGFQSPELELLGRSLERLWTDNRKLAQLAQLATRDYLTGLLNRRGFKEMAHQIAILAARNLSPISLLMIDVDHFKELNDRFGHKMGDRVLGIVSDAMISSLRSSDLLCRWGGDEFIILLPATEPEDAVQVAEKLMAFIRETQPGPVEITLSIGIAGGPFTTDCEKDLEKLIEDADAALYMAKEQGRNRCVLKPGDDN